MIESTELLQIGEFAKQAGTNLRTLRYYEELGLIEPAQRSQGGFRYYDRHQLDRMAAIKRLQHLGLSLKEILDFLVPRTGEGAHGILSRVQQAIDRQTALVEQRLREMQQDLDELRDARKKLEQCKVCDVRLTPQNCDPCRNDQQPLSAVLRSLL